MATLERAILIATKAHKKQTDRYGNPYIMHPLRVMMLGKSEEEQIAGVLHDVIEDTDWTFKDLKNEGFSNEVIEALKCLTRKSDDEDYNEFIGRILTNPLAIKVKIHDLTDNMDVRRMDEMREKDVKRFNKYLRAYKQLIKELQ